MLRGAISRPKPAPVLERTTFRTSRLAEFCSTRELVAQTGHPIAEWPLVTLKELTDNAIDICEEKDIAPEIAVSVSTEEDTITLPTMVRGSRHGPSSTCSIIRSG